MDRLPMTDASGTRPARARVWDLPTRLVHWLLAALIPFSWWAAHSDHLPWHRLSGYTILGLLTFRLIWGFAGSPTARFAGFLKGPRAVIAYLRGSAVAAVGHNPLGGWSVAAMLTVLAGQVGLGLFSVDEDALEPGPLSHFVSFDTGRAIAHLHHRLFWVLAGLIVLHLGAIAFYALRKQNLVGPMITGEAEAPPGADVPPLAAPWRILPAALAAAAVAWFVAHGLKI
jgi:cytochrome b